MLCEKCKNKNAVFFYEENLNGKKKSLSLCKECAEELQGSGEISGTSAFPYTFSPFEDSIFGGLFGGLANKYVGETKKCKSCGYTVEDFRKSGKAGCADCYKTFSRELEGTIRSIHGGAKHSGRAPARSEEKHKKETQLKDLKAELKAAIANEEFEKAANLRDSIREMEGR